MPERPILFSAPMVRALLADTKTQTRRVVNPLTADRINHCPGFLEDLLYVSCPYGQPGDRLWVREAHWWFKDEHDPVTGYFPPKLTAEDVEYRADGDDGRKVWRPSIHMPRWASRITLEITGVRVERMQDISEADALAEGIRLLNGRYTFNGGMHESRTARDSFRALWESINGAGSWDANPWVWVVEFKRVGAVEAQTPEGTGRMNPASGSSGLLEEPKE